MIKRTSKQQELQNLQQHLLTTLHRLCPSANGTAPPPPGEWPTTRQLAESNDITIYQARNLLLNLVGRGKVLVTPGPVKKSLRWYPSL
ncbi:MULTISPECIES: FaeA/PapI family transcriptional regulator [Serratia]|jgi:hypothetical protein|uniref:FaeA/PapI family transcriptional regulator n=1 Tax=Serratia marcescens TaxID=615 RepID=A0AAP8Q2S3_SERMA|nr:MULTISPECIES: FaeA/PapI family transcriptional regulator [Serratia]AIM22602.1 hypothetical protein SERRSCBI_15050 [Serratia sp. SCBI]ASM03002.1 hypothetical protein BVG88_12860 [Serratia marcescens]ETX46408.1 hypothetical protein P812_02768 [Serratia marcescens BIDMC 50]MBH1925513.1 hypothetical protein [Serratia ureilytica]MBH2538987.1 hypothetical protein [Serratia ureilytica]